MTRVRILAVLGLLGVLTLLYSVGENVVANELPAVSLWILVPTLVALLAALIVVEEWARLRRDPAAWSDQSSEAARELAAAVQAQWSAESQLRLLEQPQPIRVLWHRSDGDFVAEGQDGTTNGDPLPERGDLETVVDTFLASKSRQLCVLGRGGSGKSVLVLLMTLDLLDRHESGAVPVLLPLSSWDPREQTLSDWLSRRIGKEYEFLRARFGKAAPARLLAEGRILPILDGLDEMAEPLLPAAIKGISDEIQARRPIVVTCRTDNYVAAVHQGGHLLSAARVIEIEDVPPDRAHDYLAGDVAKGHSRWQPVVEAMLRDPDCSVARALSTPLMLWLARTAFESVDSSPSDLLDSAMFPTSLAVEDYLLDRFIPVTYSRDVAKAADVRLRDYPPEKAERWLTNFAELLYTNKRRDLFRRPKPATDFDFEWWEFFRAASNEAAFSAAVVLAIPIIVLPALLYLEITNSINERRLVAASIAGAFGVFVAWGYRPASPGRVGKPSRAGLLLRLRDGLQIGAIGGLAVGVAAVVALVATNSASQALGFGLLMAGTTGGTLLIAILFNTPVDTVQAKSPRSVLKGDRQGAALIGAFAAADALAIVWWKSGFVPSWAAGWAAAVGAGIGLTSSGWFFIVRMHFFWTRQLPFRLMPFLDDAYRRGVLRQSGSVYQFRHRRLQERLAGVQEEAIPDAEVAIASV